MAIKASNKSKLIDSRVTSGMALKAFSNRVLWLVNKHNYKFVKQHAGRSPAWWAHVVTRRWKKIKPTPFDIARIELLYAVETNRERVTAEEAADYKEAVRLISEGVELLRKHSRRHENGKRKYKPKRSKRATRNGNR